MECAVGGVHARARGRRVRLDVRRTGRLADASIGPGGGGRHAELQQREEEQQRTEPKRAFSHGGKLQYATKKFHVWRHGDYIIFIPVME
jgi:hypothetical protein